MEFEDFNGVDYSNYSCTVSLREKDVKLRVWRGKPRKAGARYYSILIKDLVDISGGGVVVVVVVIVVVEFVVVAVVVAAVVVVVVVVIEVASVVVSYSLWLWLLSLLLLL